VSKKKKAEPFKFQWFVSDSRRAQKQGWDIFEVDGDPTRYEIEALDESDTFKNDQDAILWVFKQALRGDRACIKGLLMAGLLDPQRFAVDMSDLRFLNRVVLLDTRGRKRGMDHRLVMRCP
jgi:hypothetical protein